MVDDAFCITKLEGYIADCDPLIRALEYRGSMHEYRNEYVQGSILEWKANCVNLLEHKFGPTDKHYLGRFLEAVPNWARQNIDKGDIEKGKGILKFIKSALADGLTGDPFYEQEVLVMGTLHEQASEFLKQGFRIAAAVYGRVVIEITIKEFAALHNVTHERFAMVIQELRKGGIIRQSDERSLQAQYDIGTMAVHKPDEFTQKYNDKDIEGMLNYIRDHVLTLK